MHEKRVRRFGDSMRLTHSVGTIFPSMSFHGRQPRTIAVFHPISPTEMEMWRMYLIEADAPEKMSRTDAIARILEAQPSLDEPGQVTVSSRFLVYQNRLQTEVALFVRKRRDVLLRDSESWKIAERTIHFDQNVLVAKALATFL